MPMRRAWLLVLLCGCGPAEPRVAMTAAPLPGLDLRVDVPAGVKPELGADGKVWLFLWPGQRAARSMSVAPAAGAEEAYDQIEGGLRYLLAANDGGSGGAELELRGRVAVGGREYAVTCTEQDELRPRVDWCLEVLKSLRVGAP